MEEYYEAPSSSSFSSLSITVEQSQPQAPHEALFLVLAYLPVYELLLMSQVCTTLRDAVNKDVLPWLNIVVERPLSSKLSDEILMKITSKANGRLKTLALINCVHVTNQGLQRVIEQNHLISKLYIPACTSITPEGVLRAVETLCQGSHPLSTLRINGIYNIQKEHLDVLAFYLRKNRSPEEQQRQQPIYYHERDNLSVFKHGESQRIIDLEICPKCFEVRMVYDCPKGECKRRELPQAQCRGCSFCILRCENCGRCLGSQETEECACADMLCIDCWLQEFPKCSFCNKPYCKQHTNWWSTCSESEFLCKVCEENSHGYTYTDEIMPNPNIPMDAAESDLEQFKLKEYQL
ncbi:hypothetical protein RIF29_35002 [Crotalaria pallida]|uniref:F-box domain-containing protein n=1 Tax=Crotalaria pallida TaxID=3830 RepID=A0AAN9E9Y2_CROPI